MIDTRQDAAQKRQLGEMMKNARLSVRAGDLLFSGARMAKIVGVSKDTIERYETGRIKPPLDRLLRYCETLVAKGLDQKTSDDIIHFAYPSAKGATSTRLATPIPSSATLVRQRNPQGADFRDCTIGVPLPWALRCRISTRSPYFRFGFKLLPPGGRIFGDANIPSLDSNLLIHIGRNNWDRHHLGITSQDIFITAYMSGSAIELDDRLLFRSKPEVKLLPIELVVDRSYYAIMKVNGEIVFQYVVPPALCQRVIMYAWGDREAFAVEVGQIAVQPI